LVMHWLHGLKYEEIASKMGVPLGTVQSRISRARKALRIMIAAPDSGLGLAHHQPPRPNDASARVSAA
jgi:RNA polymerase sigma-70 factor, ECF subfamily